jgi:signal transduction histidine kinase
MKLVNKFTLWYLCIVIICTIIGTGITYFSLKYKMEESAIDRLLTVNRIASDRIQSGSFSDSSVLGRKVTVELLQTPLPAVLSEISKSESPYPGSKKTEYRITARSYFTIGGRNYRITSYGYVIKADYLLSGIESTIVWKLLLILSLIAVSAGMVSRIILSPFKKTLQAIELFNLKKREKIRLQPTNTREFRELNNFVQSMTDAAVDEYVSLKEFTENASHELQTPVAVMGMKLELLAESAITREQAQLITETQDALEKLSRINSSLVLLTRLENHEYSTNESCDFGKLINESLDSYKELIEMKSLLLSKRVPGHVFVQLNPMLGHLLMNNLMSNAIRHNMAEGIIDVELNNQSLIIRNTGPEPHAPTSDMFQRFKKGNQSSKSIGIGLAIVKQICEIHKFKIGYQYESGLHIVEIQFTEIKMENADARQPEQPESGLALQVSPA